MDKYKDISNFDELIELEHRKIGTEKRNVFEQNAQMFIISEMLKEARKEANLTQEELAVRSGTKKVIFQKLRMQKGIFNYQQSFEFLSKV